MGASSGFRAAIDALELLMRRAGQVVSKRAFERCAYASNDDVNPNTVEALISRLRKRLDEIGADYSIHTLRGIGYLLRE
jgi:DNA-binding response OmpR family regulator